MKIIFMIKNKYQTVLVSSLVLILLIVIADVFYALKRMTLIEGNLDAVVNEHIYHAAMVEKMIFHARERSLLLHQLAVTDDPFEQEKIKDAF
ncbi:MAG: hypothetical protein OQK70_02015, partial [Gammaproteobacteria bacterium]|nr:hypothetical protein [Gammaproteobacteria bacterium]